MLASVTKTIILVRLQMGENIGACARSMKNFNFFNELRIVSPRDEWPNSKAISNAATGVDIVESAKIFNSLDDAISDLEYIYACTARKRDMNINSSEVKDLSVEFNSSLKTGIIFGPENSGLTNDEVSIANNLIYINANPEFLSLNISQAVMLVCYEMRGFALQKPIANNQDLATKDDLKIFLDRLFLELENKKFFKVDEKKPIMKRNIANIFNRIDNLSKSELQTLHGIISTKVN
jgi:tRNA/rRNA methyltransferase